MFWVTISLIFYFIQFMHITKYWLHLLNNFRCLRLFLTILDIDIEEARSIDLVWHRSSTLVVLILSSPSCALELCFCYFPTDTMVLAPPFIPSLFIHLLPSPPPSRLFLSSPSRPLSPLSLLFLLSNYTQAESQEIQHRGLQHCRLGIWVGEEGI